MPIPLSRLRLLLALLLVGVLLPAAYAFFLPTEDPVPIRRLSVTREKLAAEMERTGTRAVQELPRADFEARVRRAAQAGEALKNPPVLVEAQYTARFPEKPGAPLMSSGLALAGPGLWKVLNPASGPAILPVLPLNLALSGVRVGSADALLADLDGRGPGLFIEQSGEQLATFNWSARGESRPGGLHFDLEVPPCPIASLELDLPRDLAVTVTSDGCLLSGPFPAASEERRLWRITFARRSQIHLAVSRTGIPDQPRPLVEVHEQSTVELTPDYLQADFALDLKLPYQSVHELRCAFDPRLHADSVMATGLESWTVAPPPPGTPAEKASEAILIIRFKEAFTGGPLQVRCHAPLSADRKEAWHCPGLHLIDSPDAVAVPRGEVLVLRSHSEVQFEDWHPGNFRFTAISTDTSASDTFTVRTLAGGSLDVTDLAHRPSARLRTRGADYRARQYAWWQAGLDQSVLRTQITYEISRGRLFQLPIQLPADYQVAGVETAPRAQLASWRVRQDKGRSILVVDLQRALSEPGLDTSGDEARAAAAATLRLTLELHRGRARGESLPFPEVVPLGARWQEGALAIDFDEKGDQARVSTPLTAAAIPDEEGPWEKHTPDFYYPYHDQPVQGMLTLRPRATRLRSSCASDVFLASGRVAVQVRLVLKADVGNPEAFDVIVSAPVPGRWEAQDWKVEGGRNEVRRWERLPGRETAPWLSLLAPASPLDMLSMLASLQLAAEGPLPRQYRLTLAHPLAAQETLTLRCEFQGTTRDGRCTVPLLLVPGGPFDGEVRLFLAGTDVVQVDTLGLQKLSTTAPTGGPAPYRTFRYGNAPVALTLHGLAPAPDRSAEAGVDQALLTTYVEPTGRLVHRYRFQLWSRRARPVPLAIRLPEDANRAAVWVDGRRIELPSPNSFADVLDLPVPAGDSFHSYEVLYTTQAASWHLWQKLDAPPPTPLTLVPVAFRRTWCLPPGVVPLRGDRYQHVPGSGPAWLSNYDLPASFPLTQTLFDLSLNDDWAGRQARLLAEGSSSVAAHWRPGQSMTFGELLDHLVHDASPLREEPPLVLDTAALREAGIDSERPLPRDSAALTAGDRPLWEALDLVHVPCRVAPLLTTVRQRQAWQLHAGQVASEQLAEAVAEAARFGRDRSGRFQTAAAWLGCAASGTNPGGDAGVSGTFPLESYGPGWTEWELLPGNSPQSPLVVVRQGTLDALPLAAILLAALLGCAFLAIALLLPASRVPWRRPLAFLLVWLAVAGLAFLWAPRALRVLAWWPLLGGALTAAGWYLLAVWGVLRLPTRNPASLSSKSTGKGGKPSPAAVVAVVLLLPLAGALFVPGDPVRAAADASPAPVTVFVVPGPPDSPEKETVFAPLELLEQLDRLAARGAAGLRGAFLLDAHYQHGKVAGDTASFTAAFKVWCAGDEPATLTIPLAGVTLQEKVLLDGSPANPVALRAPRAGYALSIKGCGAHTVVMDFTAPVRTKDAASQVEFTVPPLLQNQLDFDAPEGATYVQVRMDRNPVWGSQQVDGTHLHAELGRLASPLRIVWRQGDTGSEATKPDVTEQYLWDLRGETAGLTGLLNYTVPAGQSLTEVAVELPAGLEAAAVNAGTLPDRAPLRLRDWRRTPAGGRRLQVLFPVPVSGRFQLALQLLPTRAFSEAAELRLPVPLDVNTAQGEVALLLEGFEARNFRPQSLESSSTAQFARAWRTAGGEAPAAPWEPAHAWSFQRKPGIAPSLHVSLHLLPEPAQADQQAAWHVGPRSAEFRLTAHFAASGNRLALLEWDLGAGANLHLASVTGPDVRSWSRSGNRVQVWLDHSVATTTVTLSGWQPLAPNAAQFVLPFLRLVGGRAQPNRVSLSASSGLSLQMLRVSQLAPLPGEHPGPELVYEAQENAYAGSFLIHRAATRVEVQSLTVAEIADQKLRFTASISCQPHQGELRSLTLRLRNWDGEIVRLDAPNVVQRQERAIEGGRAWSLELQAVPAGPYTVTLVGTMSLDRATGVPMPDVTLEEADPQRTQSWLAVVGPELSADEPRELVPAQRDDLAVVQREWPREIERVRKSGGLLWRVKNPSWGLVLHPHSRSRGGAAVRLFLTEFSAAVVDGRRWAHEAAFWLYHEANTDLSFQLPEGAQVLAIAVDDADMAPLQPTPDRLWLPLPGGEGAACVRLRWQFDVGLESLESPRLTRPRLEGVAPGPAIWMVLVPDGYQHPTPQAQTHPVGAVQAALLRAEANEQLARQLAPTASANETAARQFTEAQRRFLLAVRQAEAGLRSPAAGPSANPADLLSQLHELVERNDRLTAEPALQKLHGEAIGEVRLEKPLPATGGAQTKTGEGEARTGNAGPFRVVVLAERGLPTWWQAGTESPQVQLTPLVTRQLTGAALVSVLLLIALGALWLLLGLAWFRSWGAVFWPEQVALLACLLWRGTELTPAVLALLLLAIGGRLLLLANGAWNLLARLRHPPVPSTIVIPDDHPPPSA